MATAVQLGWEDIESTAEDRDHIERSALRIRHGARAACKRLRGERDAARTWRRITETTIRLACRILGDESGGLCELAGNVVAERDAARLELRALEWLSINRDGLWLNMGSVIVIEEDPAGRVEHPTYASAARALGWEGG
jgi:hypothetical protein